MEPEYFKDIVRSVKYFYLKLFYNEFVKIMCNEKLEMRNFS